MDKIMDMPMSLVRYIKLSAGYAVCVFCILISTAAMAQGQLASCWPHWLVTTNIVDFGSRIVLPFELGAQQVFASAYWEAPAAAGLNDGNRPVLVCRTPGDLVLRMRADQVDPISRGSPGFVTTLSPAVNVRFTYGQDTGNASMWVTPSQYATVTLHNVVPPENEKGEPLDPNAYLPNPNSPGVYIVTINKLKQYTPMNFTVELEKHADLGSIISIGGSNRISMRMEYNNYLGIVEQAIIGYWQIKPLQIISAPCQTVTNQTVNLGEHPLQRFTAVNTVTERVPFHVTVNCPGSIGVGKVVYGFGSDYPNPMAENLIDIIPGEGRAQGIAVELLKSDGTTPQNLIRLNNDVTNWSDTGLSATKKSVTLDFFARLRQVNSTVKSGEIQATAVFYINYK